MPETFLLELKDVVKHFRVGATPWRGGAIRLRAVDQVSLQIRRGETLGLVGETGCGKSTTGLLISRVLQPDSGSVVFDGHDISRLSRRQLRPFRRRIQMVFQDPTESLNPRRTVGGTIALPLKMSGVGRRATNDRSAELLSMVGLPRAYLGRYPHELSGGQRQRVGIARALATSPDLIVCDEPVSSLDVSVQAQIVRLLQELQRELGLTYIFIGHDLAVVREVSTRIAVMYLGRIVEIGERDSIYGNPQHPYTCALLSAAPIPDPDVQRARRRIVLSGDPPSPLNPPDGCRFSTRCWKAEAICTEVEPALEAINESQAVRCHFPEGAREPVLLSGVATESSAPDTSAASSIADRTPAP